MFVKINDTDRVNTDYVRKYGIRYSSLYEKWQFEIEWSTVDRMTSYSCDTVREAQDLLKMFDSIFEVGDII